MTDRRVKREPLLIRIGRGESIEPSLVRDLLAELDERQREHATQLAEANEKAAKATEACVSAIHDRDRFKAELAAMTAERDDLIQHSNRVKHVLHENHALRMANKDVAQAIAAEVVRQTEERAGKTEASADASAPYVVINDDEYVPRMTDEKIFIECNNLRRLADQASRERDEWKASHAALKSTLEAMSDEHCRDLSGMRVIAEKAELERDQWRASQEAIYARAEAAERELSELKIAAEAMRDAADQACQLNGAPYAKEVAAEVVKELWAMQDGAIRAGLISKMNTDRPAASPWTPGASLRPTLPQLIEYWQRCAEQLNNPDPFGYSESRRANRSARYGQLVECIRELMGTQEMQAETT